MNVKTEVRVHWAVGLTNSEGTRLLNYTLLFEANTMQLSYRGVKYNTSTPAVNTVDTQELGHYRGAAYHVRRAVNSAARKTNDVLKYRGAIVR